MQPRQGSVLSSRDLRPAHREELAIALERGQTGNAGGRPKSKLLSDAYKFMLAQWVPGDPAAERRSLRLSLEVAPTAWQFFLCRSLRD